MPDRDCGSPRVPHQPEVLTLSPALPPPPPSSCDRGATMQEVYVTEDTGATTLPPVQPERCENCNPAVAVARSTAVQRQGGANRVEGTEVALAVAAQPPPRVTSSVHLASAILLHSLALVSRGGIWSVGRLRIAPSSAPGLSAVNGPLSPGQREPCSVAFPRISPPEVCSTMVQALEASERVSCGVSPGSWRVQLGLAIFPPSSNPTTFPTAPGLALSSGLLACTRLRVSEVWTLCS